MKTILLLTLTAILLFTRTATAEPVIIKGQAPEYAGEEFHLFIENNPILGKDSLLATKQISDSGSFNIEIEINQTLEAYTYLGIYKSSIFIEPNNEYHIDLPARKEKTIHQKHNPYFKPTPARLGIKKQKNLETGDTIPENQNLNASIQSFDAAFTSQRQKLSLNAAAGITSKAKDSILKIFDGQFISSNNYFNQYKKYQLASLEYMISKKKPIFFLEKYFKNAPVLLNNPAYTDLLLKCSNKLFQRLPASPQNDTLIKYIEQDHSYSTIRDAFHLLKQPILKDIVILKAFYDSYFSDNFKKEIILNHIKKMGQESSSIEIRRMASEIHNKLTRLKKGCKPPDFILPDQDSNMISLDSLKEQYIYLSFIRDNDYECQKQIRLLKRFREKEIAEQLDLVSIFAGDSYEKMLSFIKKHELNWTFLFFDGRDELLNQYEIKAYPTYYLLSPSKKLLMSPAPGPNENFGEKLHKKLRERGDLYPKEEGKSNLFK
ncbi:MAG: peroxiredoxin family protein [Bacteroidota bacterium]